MNTRTIAVLISICISCTSCGVEDHSIPEDTQDETTGEGAVTQQPQQVVASVSRPSTSRPSTNVAAQTPTTATSAEETPPTPVTPSEKSTPPTESAPEATPPAIPDSPAVEEPPAPPSPPSPPADQIIASGRWVIFTQRTYDQLTSTIPAGYRIPNKTEARLILSEIYGGDKTLLSQQPFYVWTIEKSGTKWIIVDIATNGAFSRDGTQSMFAAYVKTN